MQQETRPDNEWSLTDIFRTILAKWKILILVVLLACIGGAAVGFVKTHGKNYYGSYLDFYVTPTKPSGTVSGENSTAVYGAYNKSVMDNIIKLMSSESFAESLIQQTEEEGGLPDKYKVAKYNEDGSISAAYASLLLKVKNSITFAYSVPDEDATSATSNTVARSFIYIRISVCGDENKQFAVDILKSIKKGVPKYVSANMMVPSGYDGTSCSPTTVLDEIRLLNPNYQRNTMVKYGFISGLTALVTACVVIIFIERSATKR